MSSDRSMGHQWGKERENMGPVHSSPSVSYRTQKTTWAPGTAAMDLLLSATLLPSYFWQH